MVRFFRTGRRLVILGLVVMVAFLVSLLPSLFRGGREPTPTGFVRTETGAPPPAGTRVAALGAGPQGEAGSGMGPLGETGIDGRGAFLFDPVPEGTVSFEATCGPLRARAAVTSSPAEILLPGAILVAGLVKDAETGAPVIGAMVSVNEAVDATDERGRFRLPEVPPGDFILTVSAEGYEHLRIQPPADAAWDDLYIRLTPR